MPPIDYSRYPLNWKTEIVPAVLQRANNCCELCKLRNGQKVWGVKFWIKGLGTNGQPKYSWKAIWFRDQYDAIREAANIDIINEIKVVLTVAHLDHDEENHDVQLDRLKALCQMCHLRYDAKEKYNRQIRKWETKKQTT